MRFINVTVKKEMRCSTHFMTAGLSIWICVMLSIVPAAVVPSDGIGEVLDGPWDNVSSLGTNKQTNKYCRPDFLLGLVLGISVLSKISAEQVK